MEVGAHDTAVGGCRTCDMLDANTAEEQMGTKDRITSRAVQQALTYAQDGRCFTGVRRRRSL